MRHLVLVAIAILIAGCTSGNPVTPQQDEALPTLGIINTNILGAYELTIDVDSMAVELMPKRQSAIGESWIINGKSYFETPTDYFTLCGFEFEPDVIVVKFEIKHPYEKGNPNAPPSARNRLDLNIFDLAMVVVPKPRSPINYPLLNVDIPTYVIDKPDGLTSDFAIPFESNIALPYVLVVDDSKNEPPESTFNRFEMGDSTTFEARFPIILGGSLNFDLYLTFGYGFSAVLADRLEPKYYNPEFNRKAAWKVEVYPPNGNDIPEVGNTWDNIDSSTDYTVTVKVYDWQMGANVNPDLEEKTDVYASSEVDRVSVEIPGMTNEAITVPGESYLPGGTGMPDSPLIYHIPIRNENKLTYGEYTALVAVYDERSPLDVSAGRDYLIHTSDAGKTMIEYEIPAYVTYQVFKAVVVNYHHTHCNLMWAKRAGGIKNDHVNDITTLSDDSIIITGCIESTANFGEGDPNETVLTVPDDSYAAYFARYNLDGMLIWAQFAGEGRFSTTCTAITTFPDDSFVITGSFRDTVLFDKGGTNETSLTSECPLDFFIARYNHDGMLEWVRRDGGEEQGVLYSKGITTLSDNSFVVTGYFMGENTFGQGDPNKTTLSSENSNDVFIARYNPDGSLIWAKSVPSSSNSRAYSITTLSDNSIAITGDFRGRATFGPGEPNETILNSAGDYDIYIARYNPNGTLIWAKQAGGDRSCTGTAITSLSDNSTVITGQMQGTATFGEGESNETVFDVESDLRRRFFIVRYNFDGTLAWGKSGSETSSTRGNAITALSDDSTVITGYLWGTITLGEGEPFEKTLVSAGDTDILIARYNPDGTLSWAKRAGGRMGDESFAVTTLSDDSTVATGCFRDTAVFGPDGINEIELVSDGLNDIFIARFAP